MFPCQFRVISVFLVPADTLNMATSADTFDDEIVLVTAEELEEAEGKLSQQSHEWAEPAVATNNEAKEDEHEGDLKGVALDDYQPAAENELELQRGKEGSGAGEGERERIEYTYFSDRRHPGDLRADVGPEVVCCCQ